MSNKIQMLTSKQGRKTLKKTKHTQKKRLAYLSDGEFQELKLQKKMSYTV